MKTPEQVIPPLTEEQRHRIVEIEKNIEATLSKKSDFRTTLDLGDNDHEVWRHVVDRAKGAGWDAEMNDRVVTVKRPSQRTQRAAYEGNKGQGWKLRR